MLTDTYKNMLELLADVMHGSSPDKSLTADWKSLYAEMKAQAVHGLPAACMTSLGLSPDDLGDYFNNVVKNRAAFHSLMKDQAKALALLDGAGIDAVVIKGASAAANYPQPENRRMGDIDILVKNCDYQRAFDVLSAVCSPDYDPDDSRRHVGLKTDGGHEIELHRRFSDSDNEEQNDYLDALLEDAIGRRVTVKVSGYDVPSLPIAENGIVLLSHMNQHLPTGLGLRQIIDWMCFVEKHLDDELWEGGFAEIADKIGMKRLAQVVTAMCQRYLGLDADIHWCEYEPICDELMEYILNNGNFGHKINYTKSITEGVFRRCRNPISFIAEAQSRGLINWKASKKHKWLRPFAWVYQLGRWANRGIKRGVDAKMISEANASAKAKNEFLDRLGVTRQ